MKKFMLFFYCFFLSSILVAQDRDFARKLVDTLTTETFWGRGYTNNGLRKTADFITTQFSEMGLKPMRGKSFKQELSYPVNRFPGNMNFSMNGRDLKPGIDFIVSPNARAIKASGKLIQADSVTYVDSENRLVINVKEKLTWSVAQEVADFTLIEVLKSAFLETPINYSADIEQEFATNFKTENIASFVEGTVKPDSFILITAHYDHLGGMGRNTYFPGANDNASGLALMLNLARFYAQHPMPFSIGFIAFTGEEAGLVGSKYFTEHPLIPLKNIRFLLNTDLAGTGEEGITVVNATEFPSEFNLMKTINAEHKLLYAVNPRGKAANSDHYFFTEKGVPSFFFYSLGGIKAYHDVFDKSITLPLTEHEDLFKLVQFFIEALTNPN